jgi:hypothetical protein
MPADVRATRDALRCQSASAASEAIRPSGSVEMRFDLIAF